MNSNLHLYIQIHIHVLDDNMEMRDYNQLNILLWLLFAFLE